MEFLTLAVLGGGGYWLFKQIKEMQQQQAVALRGTKPPQRVTPAEVTILHHGPEAPEHANATGLPLLRLPFEGKTSMSKYIVVGLCTLYILSPLDFIPDIFPVVGWGDDVGAALIGLRTLLFKK